MKKRLLAVLYTITLSISLMACGDTTVDEADKQETEEVQADSVEYWISKIENPDEIILTEEEIAAENALLLESNTDWVSGYYNIQAFEEQVEATEIDQLKDVRDLRHTELYFQGNAVTTEQWDAYFQNCNLKENSQEMQDISYGVVIHNTAVLDLPTNDILTDSGLNENMNNLQETTLKINEPIVILDESTDGAWLYILANEYIGWTAKENCAYFQDRQQWMDYQANSNILMVLADQGIAEIEEPLLMGTKLYLEEGSETSVRMPQKDEAGFYTYEVLEITLNDSVIKGYLPCTQRNILELAFSQLGEPYGWGGANGDRDCSSYVKDIYACFGLQLPRNSRLQMTMLSMDESLEDVGEEEKKQTVAEAEAGDILGISGHVMLYIGSANGQDYVISMLSSYIPETATENFEDHVVAANQVTVNTLDVRRRNGNTWLQELTGIAHMDGGTSDQ